MDAMLVERNRKLSEKEAYIVHLQTGMATGEQTATPPAQPDTELMVNTNSRSFIVFEIYIRWTNWHDPTMMLLLLGHYGFQRDVRGTSNSSHQPWSWRYMGCDQHSHIILDLMHTI